MSNTDLTDGVLVVTGGSRGIGAATCVAAAELGYTVVVNYVSNERAAIEVVADIESAGGRAYAVQADTGSEADIVRLFETASSYGQLTGVVNNAGITGRRCLIEEVDAQTLDRVFSVNISGYFLCAREAIKYMSTKNGGRGGVVVNVSSIAARISNAFDWVHYGASKGAVDTFTRGLALEGAEHGIRCNCVRPGMTETDINPSDRLETAAPTIPLKRVAQAEEIAEGIVWFLTPKASYCTGTVMDVTGGRG